MALLAQTTLKRDSSFATGKSQKWGPGESSGTRPGSDYEDNDDWFHLAKTGLGQSWFKNSMI